MPEDLHLHLPGVFYYYKASLCYYKQGLPQRTGQGQAGQLSGGPPAPPTDGLSPSAPPAHDSRSFPRPQPTNYFFSFFQPNSGDTGIATQSSSQTEFHDVTLACYDDQTIQAHRVMLGAVSPGGDVFFLRKPRTHTLSST